VHQQRRRQRHQQRSHKRVETHGDACEHARDRVNLKRARGYDAECGDANRESARENP
jgi:hypothetical protein